MQHVDLTAIHSSGTECKMTAVPFKHHTHRIF